MWPKWVECLWTQTSFSFTGSVEEIAKWQAHKHLADMNKMEAMRLYVRTVEEEEPDWYGMFLKIGSMQQEAAAERAPSGAIDAPVL